MTSLHRLALLTGALALLLPSGVAYCQTTHLVANAQCNQCDFTDLNTFVNMPEYVGVCDQASLEDYCRRTDTAPEITEPGSLGPGQNSQVVLFDNCVAGCPETPPPPITDSSVVNLAFTGTKTWNVSGKIEGEALFALKASLETAVGGANAFSCSNSITISVPNLPGCNWVKRSAVLNVKTGVKAKVSHTWEFISTIIQDPDVMEACPFVGMNKYSPCGTEDSTIDANICAGTAQTSTLAAGTTCPAPE